MKITLPENISEITLGQFQRYLKLLTRELSDIEFNKRKIAIFTKLPYRDISKVSSVDFKELLLQIDLALATKAEFTNRFTLNDIEYGFIPNLDNISIGVHTSIGLFTKDLIPTEDESSLSLEKLTELQAERFKEIHKAMAVLFRPIEKKDAFGNYILEEYYGDERYDEVMKEMPLHVVSAALVFFSSLANELYNSIQRYTTQELLKETKHWNILRNGTGIQVS